MAAKIKFDSSGNPESPTLVLMTRSGKKIGLINYNSLIAHISLQNPSEISFRVNKYYNGVLNNIWADIVDLKLVWCVEYDIIYQISVEIDEEDDTIKIISGVKLSQSELSQIMLYDYQINTEDDIAREDYKAPTVFYNKTNKDVSLLDRMLEKAPHYTIIHVDSTLCNIQRTFSFDNVSLYDALKQVEDEIGCIFTFPKEGGTAKIRRQIAVFDMWSNCIDCGYRGDFTDVCPKCGSKQIISGYGQDTGVFVTSDELADQISIKADVDSVKNCLKLEAGDDLMTATIKNCNPNGSSYIWNITGDMKKDMTEELVQKIDDYDTLYNKYNNEKEYYIKVNTLSGYNNVVSKYNAYKNRFSEVSSPIIGFPNIINTKYDVIDLGLFIQTELMPDASLDDTSAEGQVQLLTTEKIGTISVSNIKALSLSSANSAVLGYCKCVIDNRYTTEIIDSSIDDSNHWIGTLKVTNNSDENDTANTSELIIQINDDYETYVRQKVDKVFAKHNVDNVSITGIFKLELEEFKSEMKKYSIDMLTDFHDACQAGIDILVEQGVGTKETWAGENPNLYDDLYIPYYNKLMALEDELKEKENDLSDVKLMERAIDTYISKTHEALDFEKYLGEDLWLEFCCYRRDDKYTNQNYVSDGLNNRELFEKAVEFYECAKKEISQSAELQFSISATLNNLLVIDKFKPLLDDFTIGNWIRVEVDEKIYKLRLLEYEIDYDNLETLNVEFSNVLRSLYGISDQQSIISAVQSMATSYEYTQHQASKGEKSDNVVKDWQQNGLDTTNTQVIGGSDYQNQTWDSHGILLRKYDNIENNYEDNQMRIVNNTIAITNDNWETVKTAIGYYFYTDSDGELKSTYGINAETIVGKLVLGNELYFSNENNTMTFDKNGLSISNGTNSFIVNPDDKNLLKIKNGDKDVFYVDQDGELHITGDGTYVDVSKNKTISGIKTDISSLQELAHSHNNKSILDKIEQPYTTAERDKLAGLKNYVHPAHTAYNKGMYKVAVDDEGHVTEAETVTKSDITALGVPGENTTYEITRKGNLICLEGSDKSSSSAMTNDYVTHGAEKSYDVDPYKSYLIFYQRKPDDATSMAPILDSSEDIWVSKHHDGIGVTGTITAGHFSGADATTSQQGLMSAADKTNLDANTAARHTHANKSILDQLNEEQWKIINGAANKAHVHDNKGTLDKVTDALWNTVYSNTHTHDNKSVLDGTTASYTTAEKTKLAGIADGANKYTHPTTSGNKHIPSGGSSGQILRWSADGTAVWGADNNTTYNDATQSAHGLMTAADKKKLDGMDLSKYLPKSGGVMTGDIDMQTNKKDILVGTHKATTSDGTAVAGGSITTTGNFTDILKARKSFVGSIIDNYNNKWYDVISIRHRNGYSDGSSYGLYLRSMLAEGGSIFWNKQTGANTWQGERVLLDTTNYTSYASKSDHTHDMIANNSKLIVGSNNAAQWCRLGTLTSFENFSTTVISVWSGDGANGNASQNSWFEIHIKDGWQSSQSATKACGVTVYRTRCGTVKVKVIPTAHDTFTVWVYLPWAYWNGNYAVNGRYKAWITDFTHQTAEPKGTGADTAYYDQAFLTSTVAAATKLSTARTLTIGSTGKTFDGSANVSWSLDEIGVIGRTTAGKTYTFNSKSLTGDASSVLFNDYSSNQAGGGTYQSVFGNQCKAFNGNTIFVTGWKNTVQGNQASGFGENNNVNGEASSSFGNGNTVTGTTDIAFGNGNKVTGTTNMATGYGNTVAGNRNFATGEGNTIGANCTGGACIGNYNTCNNNASLAGGWYSYVDNNQAIAYGSHCRTSYQSSASFGAYNSYDKAGVQLTLGNGTDSARANAFRAAAGGVYSSGTYHTSGADYAEYFEWLDGNPDNEDRRGRFTKLDGEKILLAESIDDDILGVVSAHPSVTGDSYEDNWQGQYKTDIFGELLTEDYTDEDGTTRKVWVLNPDYNPDKTYVPRSERKEWNAVGMMGKLVVVDDGTCEPNKYCVPTTGGIATLSDGRVGYRVLSRVDDTHIKVLIKG